MALSDYNDPVEKIAALKAATLDPALVNISKTEAQKLSLTEDIFILYSSEYLYYLQSGDDYWYDIGDNNDSNGNYCIPVKYSENCEIAYSRSISYIKDSDINYSDPITTYQDRLAACYATASIFIEEFDNEETMLPGINGSIILATSQLKILNDIGLYVYFVHRNINSPIAVPAGITLKPTQGMIYFDVPADW